MTTITLTPELEHRLGEEARTRGITPEEVALTALRERFLPEMPFSGGDDTLSEWEREISAAAIAVEAVAAKMRGEQH